MGETFGKENSQETISSLGKMRTVTVGKRDELENIL